MKTIVELILFICNSAIFLSKQIDEWIVFSLFKAIILRVLLKNNTFILNLWINYCCHLLKFIINRFTTIFLDIVEHIVQIYFDFLHYFINLVFLVIFTSKGWVSEDIHITLNLVINVKICSNTFLQVLLTTISVIWFDDAYHLSANRIKFEVVL
jgi:hypothetical protein